MSLFVFAGAAQFAAVGYVAGGLAWPGILLLTALLNARHLLYSAALAPWLGRHLDRGEPLMAHLLTDESFALSIAHFQRLGRTDERGYWIAAHRLHVHPVEPRDARRGDRSAAQIPDPARFGLDVVFPAAMAGLAVGLLTGRRELVAALSGAILGVAASLLAGPGVGIIVGGPGRAVAWHGRASSGGGRQSGTRDPGLRRAIRPAWRASCRTVRPPSEGQVGLPRGGRRGAEMSIELVGLALLMGLVTYPSRALPMLIPGMERLPTAALDYLRLVGPAVLASLAAVNVMVTSSSAGTPVFNSGIEWAAVVVCGAIAAWRRNLLLGLIGAVALAAVARAAGLASLPV